MTKNSTSSGVSNGDVNIIHWCYIPSLLVVPISLFNAFITSFMACFNKTPETQVNIIYQDFNDVYSMRILVALDLHHL